MNTIKYLTLLVFVAVASGSRVEYTQHLIDPWGEARETCRKECGLTPEQLASAKNNLRSVGPYLICKYLLLGHINKDGTLNREVLLQSTALLNPLTIAAPIVDCCSAQVLDQRPNKHDLGILLADFTTCYKNLVPKSMWDLLGMLQPPFYNRLDHSHNN